jgi:ribosomal protein L13
MLPEGTRGKEALKRIRVFLTEGGEKMNLKNADSLNVKVVSFGELCEKLGWKK